MVTLEEAKETALSAYDGFDGFQELRDAFVFYKDSDEITDGGFGPAVVLKETGEMVNFPWYHSNTKEEWEVLSEGRL